MSAIWNFLSGRKTAIGLVLVALSELLTQVPAIVEALGGDSLATSRVVGEIIVVIGAVHKVLKGF